MEPRNLEPARSQGTWMLARSELTKGREADGEPAGELWTRRVAKGAEAERDWEPSTKAMKEGAMLYGPTPSSSSIPGAKQLGDWSRD